MSANGPPNKRALQAAEDVLRTIYGDDFKGCTVSLEQIARVISESSKPYETQTRDLLELYEKLVEAIHLLSTPPDPSKAVAPAELSALLSERLDAIYALATKTIETTSLVKAQRQGEESA